MHVPLTIFIRFLCIFLAGFLLAACSGDKKKGFEESAKGYFDAGEYDKAKIEYLNLLREDPKNATAIRQLGIMWMEQGSPVQALKYLPEACRLAPDDFTLRLKYVKVLMTIGQSAPARTEALEVLKKAPSNGEALVLLLGTARSPEEVEVNRRQVESFPDRNSAFYHLGRAYVLTQDKDTAGAEAAVKDALLADPKSLPALGVMAALCKSRKDAAGEEKALQMAAQLAPVRSQERVQYAQFKADSGKPDEAKALLADITKQAPDALTAWILTARLAQSDKKFPEALAALDHVLSRDPGNFIGRLLQADIIREKGDVKQAIDMLEKLDSAHPKQPMVLYQLGRSCLMNKDMAKATAALTDAIAAAPASEFVDAILLLSEINLARGQGAQAESAMAGILQKRPDFVPAASLLAEAFFQQRKFREGAGVMEKLVAGEPSNAQYRLRLGRFYRAANELGKARGAFTEARKLVPADDITPVAELIDVEIADNHPDVALSMAREMTGKAPQSAAAHFTEGKVQATRSAWAESEAALRKAIDLDNSFFPAYDLLIQSYVTQQKLVPAQEQLDQVLAKRPDSLPALMMSAMIFEKQQDFAKAHDRYEQMLAINPDDPAVLNNLAVLYAERLNQIEKAYEYSSRARKLRPVVDIASAASVKLESASIADTMGWIQYKRGNYPEAYQFAQEAAQHVGELPEVQYHLGMTASAMGEVGAAVAALEKAAAAAQEFSGKSDIKARLALLKPAAGQEPGTENLKALLQANPGDVLLHIRLAEACEKAGDFAAAAAAWENAFNCNPKLVAAAAGLARLHSGPLKNHAGALKFAREAYKLAPGAEAAGVLGIILYSQRDYPEAYQLLKESSLAPAPGASVLYHLAWAAYSQSRVDEAREAMQKISKVENDSAKVAEANQFLMLTAPQPNSQEQPALVSVAEGILGRDPNHVPALMIRAAGQMQGGKNADAAGSLRKVLEVFPDFAPAQQSLAALMANEPDQREQGYVLALKARETLGRVGQQPADLARTLAVLSFYKQKYDLAVELFKEAPPAGPQEAEQLYCYGMALWNTSQKADAQTKLRSALATQRLPEPLAAEAKRLVAEPGSQ